MQREDGTKRVALDLGSTGEVNASVANSQAVVIDHQGGNETINIQIDEVKQEPKKEEEPAEEVKTEAKPKMTPEEAIEQAMIEEIYTDFCKFDTDGSGKLSMTELE